MSSSDEGGSSSSPITATPATPHQNPMKRYKGVRRRKWGKWVSEIRVPGSRERLWLGSYVAPEAAAVAHDIAYYCLRERTSPGDFNFPSVLPSGVVEKGMSPRSIQKAATDAGMGVDAQIIIAKQTAHHHLHPPPSMEEVNIINAPAPAPAAVSNPNPNSNSIPNITEALELDISVEDYL